MKFTDNPHAQTDVGDVLDAAIRKVRRLRQNHDALLVALRWCLTHDGECPRDYPDVLAKLRAAMATAEAG